MEWFTNKPLSCDWLIFVLPKAVVIVIRNALQSPDDEERRG